VRLASTKSSSFYPSTPASSTTSNSAASQALPSYRPLTQNNYPYFPINLPDEIAKRKPEQAFFKESELWYLLYALVAAKMDLRMHGYRLGDVRPQSELIDNKGKAKVANLLSAPNQTTAFAKPKIYKLNLYS
jgi:hypothetical protein